MLLKFNIKNLAGINLALYSLLVVLTPFIMLQNYLQGFVHHVSGLQTNFLGMFVPVVVLIFGAALFFCLIVFRKLITYRNLAAVLVVFLSFAAGQFVSDYYIDFRYYDLQNNWHYFTYFIFVFVAWAYFKQRKLAFNKILSFIWLMALGLSLFDELFQNQLSQRIFDLSDVAKDLWGTTTGLIILTFWFGEYNRLKHGFKVRQETFSAYLNNSVSLLVVLFVLSGAFLVVSSLLTEKKYAVYVALLTLMLVSLFVVVIHNFKGIRKRIITALISVLLIAQIVLVLCNRNSQFIFHNNFLTVYKGWFLPFFDVMVFPDNTFRFVDKKIEFNNTDKQVIMKSSPDVILIGAGKNKEGGNGFPSKENSHFILNPRTRKPVQIIILDSKSACLKYNELSDRGIKTVMVLHKTL